ncbi:MAG: hypothetical protein J1E95_01885 [Muribaculaceae bacterium]|nr:hypothetical protein [Muribaculaceae bacterium]
MSAKLTGAALEKRRKQVEASATFGLLLICAALIAPFTNPTSFHILSIFRWIYGAGAIIYIIARLVDISDPKDSPRLKRLRRMEFWAGVAFAMATGFWFYGQHHFGEYSGALVILKNTILFTLVGALIQIFATWMIYLQTKKELRGKN